MRKLIVATLIVFCAALAAASDNVAQVQLPCESRDQVLSPTGRQLAFTCTDHSLHLLSVPDGRPSSPEVSTPETQVSSLAYSLDGLSLAIGFKDGSVQVNSTQGTATYKVWKASSRRIEGLCFLPDAKILLVVPLDTPGQVWELAATPKLLASLPTDFGGISAYAASPDGKTLVVAGGDTVIRWYDTTTWLKTREDRGFLLETFALSFTPDSKQLLVGGANGRVVVVDAASGKQIRQLPPDAGSSVADIQMLGDHERVATLDFDDAGEKPPHAIVWNLSSAKSTPVGTKSPPTCGGVVAGKLWLCNTDGKTLTISQYE